MPLQTARTHNARTLAHPTLKIHFPFLIEDLKRIEKQINILSYWKTIPHPNSKVLTIKPVLYVQCGYRKFIRNNKFREYKFADISLSERNAT